MALAPGTRLGPYEVIAPLGAGGMGEVYRAKDGRLGRSVAVKVLPDRLARDEEARRRFEREARAVAALSHPNILAIHDFGADADLAYAVMELLEGETLRARLGRGPLPWRKAVETGVAIADGLAAAHARGIVHRDLKPENVFLTSDGRVKILDFGLARSDGVAGPEDETRSFAGEMRTDPGTVLGTVGYMSPEQVRGLPADARSDIFSLGCAIHEMVTGSRAFARGTAAEIMAAILNEDPSEAAGTGKAAPPDLQRVISHCLEKNREERFQSARDLGFALKSVSAGSGASLAAPALPRGPFRAAPWIAAVAALGVAFFLGRLSPRAAPAQAEPAAVALTSGAAHEFAPAISADGKFVAYLSDAGGRSNLWVKFIGGGLAVNLTERSGLEIEGNSGVGGPDISPDGTAIAVSAGPAGTSPVAWGVWVVPAPLGGAPRKLMERGAAGARWSPDGTRIAFTITNTVSGDAIAVARADGQDERVLVPAAGGVHLHQAAWSHDGAFIYFIRTINPNNEAPTEIWRVASQGGAPERVVPTTGVALNPQPTPDGALIYAGNAGGQGLNLWRRPLQGGAERRLTTGAGEYVEPRLSRDGRRLVCTARIAHASLAVADAGSTDQKDPSEALTGARSGDSEPTVSAKTGRIVFSSTRSGVRNLWVLDVRGTEPRQLTSERETDERPAISPDGNQVAFVSNRGGRRGIWLVSAEGGVPRRLVEADVLDGVSWSPDGRRLVYCASAEGELALWLLPIEGGAPTRIPGVKGRVPAWSPTGDVIAYVAEEGPRGGAVRFTDSAGRPVLTDLTRPISAANAAAWSHDGRRLGFSSTPGTRSPALWVLDLASGRFTRIATFPSYSKLRGVSWSADDASVVFGRVEYDSHILLLDGIP
jgi:eukaryotic-like serine/threonine-protein kinase